MLNNCLPRLLPVITDIVNHSLDKAFIPNSLKTALIITLLKKTNLNTEDFKNFVRTSISMQMTVRFIFRLTRFHLLLLRELKPAYKILQLGSP